ncbi:MAG: chloride channel protein [Salinigranum sp.]
MTSTDATAAVASEAASGASSGGGTARRRVSDSIRRARSMLGGGAPLSLPEDEEIRMNLAAIAIGIIAGLGAVVFRITIYVSQELFFGKSLNPGSVAFDLVSVPNLFGFLAPLGPLRYLLIPAVGGLFVGVVIVLTTPEVRGHGVPKVLEAMLVRGGEIDPKITLYKTVASSIAIGSGASLGREGPIVQIVSAAGSYFGKYLDSKHTRTLVAAGAAGGIAGTFNTPIAGIMFALEILLAEYYLRHVIAVVLSAVMATAVARPLLAFTPSPGVRDFLVPVHYQMVSPAIELPIYIVLGIFVAFAGVGVVKLLYGIEHRFERLDVPVYTKPAVGGALLGLSALVGAALFGVPVLQATTWLFGVGYSTIHTSISGELAFSVLLGLAVLKAIGFSLSVGSGSSGGVFSPSLYIGAMLGGGFGVVVDALIPGTAGAGAYALVGMGGVFAAAASAPLTATIIIFELTGQYTIILPLLVVGVIGSELTNSMLNGGTIYTEKLRDRGFTVQERRIGSLEDLTAADVMTTDVDTLPAGTPLEEALTAFRSTEHHGIPIVDGGNHLVGIVVLSDVQKVLRNHVTSLADGRSPEATCDLDTPIESVGSSRLITASPDANLLSVVDLMEVSSVGRIPIVDEDDVLLGIVTRSDVLDAYDDIPLEIRRKLSSGAPEEPPAADD